MLIRRVNKRRFSQKSGMGRIVNAYQTRRRLGGRQPLCGMGVTSRMSVTLKPAD
jgi:hypothetical protein